jgi:hypothetical protein
MRPYDQEEPQERPAGVVQVLGWPEFPAGVKLADGLALDSDDPARPREGMNEGVGRSGRSRRCVAQRNAGGRCGAPAITSHLLCSMHAGRADPRQAAQTRHRLAQEAKDRVRDRAAAAGLGALGTRSLVAETLVAEHDNLRKALKHLAAAAGAGDIKAAQALLPWLNQALGNPTERAEIRFPTTGQEAQSLSTSQLEALVAQGREARLAAAPDNGTA